MACHVCYYHQKVAFVVFGGVYYCDSSTDINLPLAGATQVRDRGLVQGGRSASYYLEQWLWNDPGYSGEHDPWVVSL